MQPSFNWDQRGEDCKGGAQEEDTTVWCTRSSNVDGSLPRCETLKFRSTVEFRSPGTGRLDIVSRGEDDSITFQSPVSGNVVASFSASSFNDGCFATLARVLCRGEIRRPPFAITFFPWHASACGRSDMDRFGVS